MIDLNTGYKKIEAYTRGRKEKIWFSKDGTKYLYKFGASYYEIYAELIAEKLGTQCGIEMANYNVATYNNSIGVLTKSFLKTGELIISSDKLKKAVSFIYEENNINGNLSDNTISNLLESAFTYDPTINTEKLYKELVKRWIFYGTIMESDKNETNISFKKNRTKLSLTPDYDNSTMCRLNENIRDLLTEICTTSDVHRVTSNIQQVFKPSVNSSDDFLESFEEYANKNKELVSKIFKDIKKMDIDKAIDDVEVENEISVPWEIKTYLNLTISSRIKDMEAILSNKTKKRKMID